MSSSQIIQTSAMPSQTLIPLPPGASSPMAAGVINQQNQNKLQNQLGSGKKRRRKSRGGASVVQVPPVSTSSPNPQLTGQNYTDLTKLASTSQSNAQYDNLAQKGGTKRMRSYYSRGGYWPKWGCLSGGKKSKKYSYKIKTNSKRNKSKKTKRRY
jgi:hypothetical protein